MRVFRSLTAAAAPLARRASETSAPFGAALALLGALAAGLSGGGVAALDDATHGAVVETATGRALDGPEALAAALAEVDVVFLGEVHDNPEHHAGQAWLVDRLGPSGLTFEMIPAELEAPLERLRAEGAGPALLGHALQWSERGWPDFAMYAPIFAAAPEAAVTGAEIGMEALGAAMRGGADAAAREAIGASAALYRLDEPPAPEAAEAMAEALVAAHCDAIPLDAARGMIGAQRLRDAALADAALRARALGGDGPVVVIAGSEHARGDRGAPAYLAAARPGLEILTVGFLEWDEAADADPAAAPFDFVWLTAPAERQDPCVAFRERHGRE